MRNRQRAFGVTCLFHISNENYKTFSTYGLLLKASGEREMAGEESRRRRSIITNLWRIIHQRHKRRYIKHNIFLRDCAFYNQSFNVNLKITMACEKDDRK